MGLHTTADFIAAAIVYGQDVARSARRGDWIAGRKGGEVCVARSINTQTLRQSEGLQVGSWLTSSGHNWHQR